MLKKEEEEGKTKADNNLNSTNYLLFPLLIIYQRYNLKTVFL